MMWKACAVLGLCLIVSARIQPVDVEDGTVMYVSEESMDQLETVKSPKSSKSPKSPEDGNDGEELLEACVDVMPTTACENNIKNKDRCGDKFWANSCRKTCNVCTASAPTKKPTTPAPSAQYSNSLCQGNLKYSNKCCPKSCGYCGGILGNCAGRSGDCCWDKYSKVCKNPKDSACNIPDLTDYQQGACKRPASWCTRIPSRYGWVDCDGDGLKDHACFSNGRHTVIKSTKGCKVEDWVDESACAWFSEKHEIGTNGVCDICRGQGSPTKPNVWISGMWIGQAAVESCATLYERGKKQNIPHFMCGPLIDFAYESCGCGL